MLAGVGLEARHQPPYDRPLWRAPDLSAENRAELALVQVEGAAEGAQARAAGLGPQLPEVGAQRREKRLGGFRCDRPHLPSVVVRSCPASVPNGPTPRRVNDVGTGRCPEFDG